MLESHLDEKPCMPRTLLSMFAQQFSMFGITLNQELDALKIVDSRFYDSVKLGPGLLKLNDCTASRIRPWSIYLVDGRVAQVVGAILTIDDQHLDSETTKKRLTQILPTLVECDLTPDTLELETVEINLSIMICDQGNQYTLTDTTLMSLWTERLKPSVSKEVWLRTGSFYEE